MNWLKRRSIIIIIINIIIIITITTIILLPCHDFFWSDLQHSVSLYVQVSEMMTPQFSFCTETHWTFTANIRLHTFMTTYVFRKTTTVAEFLLTNVTRQPSTFIV